MDRAVSMLLRRQRLAAGLSGLDVGLFCWKRRQRRRRFKQVPALVFAASKWPFWTFTILLKFVINVFLSPLLLDQSTFLYLQRKLKSDSAPQSEWPDAELKSCPNFPNVARPFLFFRSFQTQFYRKMADFSGIRSQIVGVEGEHADHLTTTTWPQPLDHNHGPLDKPDCIY